MIEWRLADIARGESVEFIGFDATIDPMLRDRLLAYGLAPAQRLDVLQQTPLTIVVCDHAELALESSVARSMRVRARATRGPAKRAAHAPVAKDR
jgi:Fe2+ transport system protein FeoA